MNISLLGLQIELPNVHMQSANFRPPSWPPPENWAPILDAEGNPVCLYGDSTWPLDVWAGKPLKLNFGDGKTKGKRIDRANASLLRQCVTWFLFGPRGCRTAASLYEKLTNIKPIFAVCSREGILASDLMRFHAVIDKIASTLALSNFDRTIVLLHDLLGAREHLGFCLLDQNGIARLARLQPAHDSEQTPYIPPRIWTYQLGRLRDCLEDFAEHRERVENCFQFCVDAYAHSAGSLNAAMTLGSGKFTQPFRNGKSPRSKKIKGPFKLTADRFGITELLERWTGPFTCEKAEGQLKKLSQYLDLVSKVGLAYLLNFSLMRIEEGYSLRSNCLLVEHDEKFGDIHMLVGETTKTDPDSDARWTVSKSVPLAIDALKHVAALRMRCIKGREDLGVTAEDEENPHLITFQREPWSSGKRKPNMTRPAVLQYQQVLSKNPLLLDGTQIAITADDLQVALMMTPTLDKKVFKVGEPWPFAWHQLRRTGAVNMLASGLVDEPSLQLQLKHLRRAMTLYYGRNHSRLTMNEAARTFYLKNVYQELAHALSEISGPKFVSPLGEARKDAVVNWISAKDAASLTKAVKSGEVSARQIRAGFCFNARPCPYGGIESITHCLGGDDGKGCPDLLMDLSKIGDIKRYERAVDQQLAVVQPDSPRSIALQAEKRSIAKFYGHFQA